MNKTKKEIMKKELSVLKTPVTEDMIQKIFDSTITEEYKGAHSIGCRN